MANLEEGLPELLKIFVTAVGVVKGVDDRCPEYVAFSRPLFLTATALSEGSSLARGSEAVRVLGVVFQVKGGLGYFESSLSVFYVRNGGMEGV